MEDSEEDYLDHRADNRRLHFTTGGASLPNNPNAPVITNFLNYFTPGNANYGNVGSQSTSGSLMTLFSANSPIVGITDHGDANIYVVGPGFVGQAAIQGLFAQFFMCFAALTLKDVGFPWMSSNDQQTIAVRFTLQGTQQGPWFSQGNPNGNNYSLPLSEIAPSQNASQIPSCSVFTFDNTNLITNLSLYMDRYKLMRDLQPEAKGNFDKKVKKFINTL